MPSAPSSVTCAPRRLPNASPNKMSDYNHVNFPRKLLKKFILLYKELPCLWDRDDTSYRIKMRKHAALTHLTELVQQYDPNATRVHVLRKIDSLRACVRREYKRVQDSRRFATSDEEIYKPNLWYYDLFSFICENSDKNAAEVSKYESEQEEEDNEEQIDNEQHDTYETESYQSEYNIPVPVSVVELDRPSTSAKRSSPLEDAHKSKRSKTSTEVEDEYDAIGINVAAKLRHLPANMRILAEKLINDVLFQAQTNGLNSSTKIVTSDPFKQETANNSTAH